MISFLDLPGEIRALIYSYSLDPNEYVKGYRQVEDQLAAHTDRSRGPSCTYPYLHVKLYTPSILLVNRQITKEALHSLRKIPLNLEAPPNTTFPMCQIDITEFLCENLLRQIHYGVLRLDFANKEFVLRILNIWNEKNSLRRLDVYYPWKTQLPRDHWTVVKRNVLPLLAICNFILIVISWKPFRKWCLSSGTKLTIFRKLDPVGFRRDQTLVARSIYKQLQRLLRELAPI